MQGFCEKWTPERHMSHGDWMTTHNIDTTLGLIVNIQLEGPL